MAIVAVQDFRREEKDNIDDLLNKVGKGLQIAQAIYGFKTAGEQSDLRKLQIAEAERKSKTEKLQSELMDRGIYTQDQVVENKLVTFKTKNDLAKAVGEDTWEGAVKKYPALEANIFRLNVATPKQIITEKTGEMVGIDDLGRTEKIAPAIIKPETIQDYDVNAFDAVIPRDVLEKFTQGKVGGALDEMTFREKFMPLDEETFQRIPSEISSLREKVPVLVDNTVVNRWGVRRSSVRPTTPYQAIQIEKAGIELGKVREEEAKRVKIKDLSKVGIVADEDFDKNYISVDSPEALQKRTPSLFKNLPEGAVEKFTVEDLDTGIQVEKYGIRRETWDNALSIAKAEKEDVSEDFILKQSKEYRNSSKSTLEAIQGYKKVIAQAENPNPNGASDMALLFGYMKSIDPGSVVRESEFKTAEATTPAMERYGITKLRDKVLKGALLTPEQRKRIVEASKNGILSQLDVQATFIDPQFINSATANNVDPNRIINPAFETLRTQLRQKSTGKSGSPAGYVRIKKGNDILDIPAELLPEAEKDGYKLMK